MKEQKTDPKSTFEMSQDDYKRELAKKDGVIAYLEEKLIKEQRKWAKLSFIGSLTDSIQKTVDEISEAKAEQKAKDLLYKSALKLRLVDEDDKVPSSKKLVKLHRKVIDVTIRQSMEKMSFINSLCQRLSIDINHKNKEGVIWDKVNDIVNHIKLMHEQISGCTEPDSRLGQLFALLNLPVNPPINDWESLVKDAWLSFIDDEIKLNTIKTRFQEALVIVEEENQIINIYSNSLVGKGCIQDEKALIPFLKERLGDKIEVKVIHNPLLFEEQS